QRCVNPIVPSLVADVVDKDGNTHVNKLTDTQYGVDRRIEGACGTDIACNSGEFASQLRFVLGNQRRNPRRHIAPQSGRKSKVAATEVYAALIDAARGFSS